MTAVRLAPEPAAFRSSPASDLSTHRASDGAAFCWRAGAMTSTEEAGEAAVSASI